MASQNLRDKRTQQLIDATDRANQEEMDLEATESFATGGDGTANIEGTYADEVTQKYRI